MKSKQEKLNRRLKRVKKVMEGKMDIEKLGLKELAMMHEIVHQISIARALEEIKSITPDQIH